MEILSESIKGSFRFAMKHLPMVSRRAFAADICMSYYGGSSRKMEREFGGCRQMIETGLGERRTAIVCENLCRLRGRKKKRSC